jgi:hypothetical protein
MRQLSSTMLDAIAGSVPDARLTAAAWYDGTLREPSLPVSTWSISWEGSDSTLVQGKATVTVADPTGRLAPWGFDEPLSAAGSRLQLTFWCGDESVDLGWFTVAGNKPTEQWRLVGVKPDLGVRGASIPVDADDLTRLVQDSGFISPEAPPADSTVITEVRRLMSGICPVTVASGVVDAGSLPPLCTRTTGWPRSRTWSGCWIAGTG